MNRQNMIGRALAVGALCCSVQAQAAVVDAEAIATLSDVATTGTATFTVTGGFYLADVFANDLSPSYVFDTYFGLMGGSASVSQSVGGAMSDAFAEAGTSSGGSSAHADGAGNAFASSLSEIDFMLGGVGQVSLTFDVLLALDISGSAGIEFAEAAVTVTDSLGAYEDAFAFGDGALGDTSVLLPGSLMLTYMVDGPTTGFFTLETVAYVETGLAPVPIPAALWLLSGGLIALFRFRRQPK